MRNIFKKISLHAILLFVVMLIAVFYRFYNTPARYGFDYDPVRDALLVDYAAKTFNFPLIGPPSGIGPFTFGPWYYYQLIIFKIIFPVDYSPWIYIGILSTLTVFMMYKIGFLLNGRKLGLILAALTALSPAETGQIRALSNPTMVPFFTVLTIWIFLKLSKKKEASIWAYLLWGFFLGIGINNHYQMAGMVFLPVLFFIFNRSVRRKRVLFFTTGFLISFLPLLIFNYLNQWKTVNGLVYYISQGSSGIYVPNRWLFYIRNFWPEFTSYVLGVPTYLGMIIGLFIAVIILYSFKNKNISRELMLLIVVFLINFIGFRFFSGQREYYYLLFLHSFIFIFFGYGMLQLFKLNYGRLISVTALFLVSIGMISQSNDRLAVASDQLLIRNVAQQIAKNYPKSKIVLYECRKEDKSNEARGIAFFLNSQKKLDNEGIKIAFASNKCNISKYNIKHIGNTDLADVSGLSNIILSKYGLVRVTPKTVYNQLFSK